MRAIGRVRGARARVTVAALASALCAVLGSVAPAAAATGLIRGTVTEAGTGDPVGGVLQPGYFQKKRHRHRGGHTPGRAASHR